MTKIDEIIELKKRRKFRYNFKDFVWPKRRNKKKHGKN